MLCLRPLSRRPRTLWAAAAVNVALCDFSFHPNIVLQFAPTARFCYMTNEIKFKTHRRASARDSLVTALVFMRTLLAKPWFRGTPPPLIVQWHDCLLSLQYCFHCHFLILVYGPRCWQRGAIPQKRHFRAASDVLCGVVLLKQQTQTRPPKKPKQPGKKCGLSLWQPVLLTKLIGFIVLQLQLCTLIQRHSRFLPK